MLSVREHEINDLTERVIGAAIEVHRTIGPGALESVYARALAIELGLRGIPFRAEVPVPITYKGHNIGVAYRVDLIVDEAVVVELKAIESVAKVHEAQVISYLKGTGLSDGLLINFNVERLAKGVRRLFNRPPPPSS